MLIMSTGTGYESGSMGRGSTDIEPASNTSTSTDRSYLPLSGDHGQYSDSDSDDFVTPMSSQPDNLTDEVEFLHSSTPMRELKDRISLWVKTGNHTHSSSMSEFILGQYRIYVCLW